MESTINKIPVYRNSKDERVVVGKELHEFLDVDTPYGYWFDSEISPRYVEGVDYTRIAPNEHFLSYDMALEIAMLESQTKSYRIRQELIGLAKEKMEEIA